MRFVTFAAPLLLLPLLPGAAHAQSYMQVTQAWARASPSGSGPIAAYFTLHDSGQPDQLTSVTADAAGMAMLHQSSEQGGVSAMRGVQAVAVPAGGTVVFRPGGLHVMLDDLNRRLKPGDTFQMVLTFNRAPPVTATVRVLPVGSSGP